MNRLVINPGTPQALEVQLKPGVNTLGRGEANDFKINDPSVSGSHCRIVASDSAVVLTDLGSTNGTFFGGARVQEIALQNGSRLKLGGVEIMFYSVANQPPEAPVAAVPPPVPPPTAVRIARVAAPAAAAPVVETDPTAVMAPEVDPAMLIGERYCKFHPKSAARVLCVKCNRTYCDLCVDMRNVGGGMASLCRACGSQALPFQFWQPPAKGFYAQLPAAFVYPFKGAGVMILICATIAFSALRFVSGGILGIVVRTALYGFVFLFMQNIILTTTSDEKETLGFPEFGGLYAAAFQLFGTVLASFWLAIGLAIARWNDVDIPSEAIIASVILGGIYFPMALLVVAMKESVLAANPLIVIPAMLKVPLKYSVTVVLLLGVFGIRQLGSMISSGAGTVALRTTSENTFLKAMGVQMVWALLSVYLLTVTMRILGLFYNSSKQKLGWFSR